MTEQSITEREKILRIIRFFHPEKRFAFLPGADNRAALATLFGLTLDEYSEIRSAFQNNVAQTARELLAEPEYAEDVKALGEFGFNSIAVIGDSLTDDYQSWFEILKASYQSIHPQLDTSFINTALSGDTSAALLSTAPKLKAVKPELLFCFIGTNDGRIQAGEKECVGLPESKANLNTIAEYCSALTRNFVWITPPGVMLDRIRQDWLLQAFGATWNDNHIVGITDYLLSRPEPVIDLTHLFAGSARPDLFLEDGLHWSLKGQKATARTVARQIINILTNSVE